jgi:hypothetical protein
MMKLPTRNGPLSTPARSFIEDCPAQTRSVPIGDTYATHICATDSEISKKKETITFKKKIHFGKLRHLFDNDENNNNNKNVHSNIECESLLALFLYFIFIFCFLFFGCAGFF